MSSARSHHVSPSPTSAETSSGGRCPGKVLVIRLGSLGDVVLTTPVLSSLHAVWPETKIDIAVKSEFADIFCDDPRVNDVRAFDSHGAHKGLSGLLTYISGLRDTGYDLILDLHRNLRSFAMRMGQLRSKSVVYRKDILRRRLLVWRGPSVKNGGDPRHTVRKYLDVLRPLGFPPGDGVPRIHLSRDNVRWADEYLRNVARGQAILGIAPTAAWATKQWPGERFRAVAERISRGTPVSPVFFGGPKDGPLLREIAGEIGPVLTGDAGLKNLAAVIQRCVLFLTNDSGLMHLATSVGTPVLAIFGPTTRSLGFFPLGPRDSVLEKDLPCRPCTLHGDERCPQGHFQCMNLITVDEVFDLVRRRITPN